MILAFLLAAAAPQATPVPPPVVQVTADCARPTYATDMLVCDDPSLKAMDDRLKSALADAATLPADTPLIENQIDWFRRSRRCAFQTEHRDCAAAAYGERLTVIALAAAPASPTGQCRLGDKTGATISVTKAGAVLLRDGDVIAVGVASTSAWQPFVTFRRHGDRADFRDQSGRLVATCRFTLKKGEQ